MDRRRLLAETIGTAWLVIGGVGTAVLLKDVHAPAPAIALAFGLSLLTMAYAIGPISGCHVNPAVTLALAMAGRVPRREVPFYWGAQVLGATLGAAVVLAIAKGHAAGYDAAVKGLGSNGYGTAGGTAFSLWACLGAEVVLTAGFVLVVLAATSSRSHPAIAGIAAGFALTLVHLVGIPVTGTSVNPARSTGPALWAGGTPLAQLWAFWAAPLVGGALAALAWKGLRRDPSD